VPFFCREERVYRQHLDAEKERRRSDQLKYASDLKAQSEEIAFRKERNEARELAWLERRNVGEERAQAADRARAARLDVRKSQFILG